MPKTALTITKDHVIVAITPLLGGARIANIVVEGEGAVGCILNVNAVEKGDREALAATIEKAISNMDGVTSANVVMTAERTDSTPETSKKGNSSAPPKPAPLAGVKQILAISSGKGGVGKSTTAVNIALALRAQGMDVGLLDLDIFGPSLPTLLGIEGQRPSQNDSKQIVPILAHGMKVLSIGLMVDNNQPIVWRGPRVMGATQQMLRDTAWGPLDVLVIDMPPGTGDVQLSMVQNAPITGAVIISTPQDLALIDARKGIAMFEQMEVPVLGVVENMSTFACPHCGEESHIFGHGGAAETAGNIGASFLGEIPLHMDIRRLADAGTPIVSEDSSSLAAKAYSAIAEKIAKKLS